MIGYNNLAYNLCPCSKFSLLISSKIVLELSNEYAML